MGKLKQINTDLINPASKVIILCGACKGEQIDYFHYYNPNATIYVIEPMPRNMDYIKEHYGDYPRLVFIQKACWSSNGVNELIDYTESHKHSFYTRPQSESKRKGKVEVEMMDFAEFIDSFDKVDFIRMNIEGAEYPVLFHCFEKGVMNKVKHLDIQLHAGRIPALEKHRRIKGGQSRDALKDKLLAWAPKESNRWKIV